MVGIAWPECRKVALELKGLSVEGGTAIHMRKPFRDTRYVEMKSFTQDYTVKNAGGTAVIRPAAEMQQDFLFSGGKNGRRAQHP